MGTPPMEVRARPRAKADVDVRLRVGGRARLARRVGNSIAQQHSARHAERPGEIFSGCHRSSEAARGQFRPEIRRTRDDPIDPALSAQHGPPRRTFQGQPRPRTRMLTRPIPALRSGPLSDHRAADLRRRQCRECRLPGGTCAEAGAIAAMVVVGETRIAEILVIGAGDALVTPCGACRHASTSSPRARRRFMSRARSVRGRPSRSNPYFPKLSAIYRKE